MARLGKETAKRSIGELIDKLPRGAAVEIVNHDRAIPPLPKGVGLRVKIDVQTVPDETVEVPVTTEAKPAKAARLVPMDIGTGDGDLQRRASPPAAKPKPLKKEKDKTGEDV